MNEALHEAACIGSKHTITRHAHVDSVFDKRTRQHQNRLRRSGQHRRYCAWIEMVAVLVRRKDQIRMSNLRGIQRTLRHADMRLVRGLVFCREGFG